MGDNSNGDGWFGSWLSAAKNKSSEVLEFVKKDLEEFRSVVKNEASNVVASTGSVIEKTLKLDSPDSTASTMKKSISSFLGQVNTVLNPSPDDSDTEAILIGENSETIPMTRLQQALLELQKNPKTYLQDPEPELLQQFHCWLEIIEDQLSDERIEKQVNSSNILKQQYCQLVPESVEHQLFWKRYLFKKALLEDEIARQEALEKREIKEKNINEEETVKWEDEDFSNDIELTEEQQIRLLEEYENETKSKKGKKAIAKKKSPVRSEVDKIKKNESGSSLDTPSSNSSTDGDWEKVSDVSEK